MVYCTARIFAKIRGIMGLCTFFLKESQTRKFTFYSRQKNPLVEFLPVGMKETVVFHTHFLQKSTCGKQRENFSFQQKETTLSGKAVRL